MPPAMEGNVAETLRKSAVARYLQLASLFRRRIETGEWPLGQQVPTIGALAAQFGVAGMTIRQAMDILEKEGLIERHRAKGTFVKEVPKRNLWCEVQTDWSGLLIARQNAHIEILSDERDVKLPAIDTEGGGAPAPAYRHLLRRHSRDGTAFLLANVYVDERLCAQIAEGDYTTKTAMRLVADVPGITISDAMQILTIESADPETSNLLNIPLGEAVAQVKRIAIDQNGCLVLVANGIYRGDMVRIEMKLR